MSISNGQIANQTTFNNAFVSKQALNQDVDGTINLTNSSSGADVNNLQQEINDIKTTNANQDSDITNLENSRVVKAASSTDNTLPRFDGTDGQIIQPSGVVVDDSDNMTIPGSLTVTGDLTVNGTTTTINTATLDVEDSNITINDGGNDATAEGAGVTVERTGTHGKFLYEDALASKFKIGAAGSEAQVTTVSHTQTLSNKTIVVANNTITTAASGNLTSTELNAALAELQGDIDALGSPSDYIAKSLVDAKGDLIAGSADNTVVRLPVGSNGQVLSADSAEASGLKWISAASNNLSITTKTANYTATTADDVILCDASSGSFTITLFTSAGNTGKVLKIIKTDSSTNSITVDGNGSETIAGYLTYLFSVKNNFIEIVADGSNWQIISESVTVSFRAKTAAGQSIPNNTETTVVFGTVDHNTHGSSMYNSSTGVFTAPYSGLYQMSSMITFAANPTSNRISYFKLNTTNYIGSSGISANTVGNRSSLNGSTTFVLSAGDTVLLTAYQNTGAALSLFANGEENYFNICKVG